MAKREADANLSRVRFLERRATGQGAMQPGDRVVDVVNADPHRRELDLYCLSERLKMVNAMLTAKVDHATTKEKIPVLQSIIEEYSNRANSLAEDELYLVMELHERVTTIKEQLEHAQREVAEYICAICRCDLEPGKVILGKNCYHMHCLDCVSQQALIQVKPILHVTNHPVWEFKNTIAAVDITESDQNVYELREGMAGTFPSNIHTSCSICRNDSYADQAYYDACVRLQADPRPSPTSSAPVGVESAESKVQAYRDDGLVLLLQAPGYSSKVMLVSSKIPRSPVDERMQHMTFQALCRDAGFTYGAVGGGSAMNRNKVEGEEVDGLPLGATLRLTAQRMVTQQTSNSVGEDGRRTIVQERVLSGGDNYRVDLPPPATA